MASPQRARVLLPTPEGIAQAGRVLASGGLCAFPTETVYGLGANALDETAVLRIFEAKRRPLSDPLIVHVAAAAEAEALLDLADDSPTRSAFGALAERFWPGPLTVVAPAAKHLPRCLSAGTDTVGVRCPSHPIARRLIEAAGSPVAAPSANLFGHVSPTSARHVLDDLGDQDIWILDGQEDAVCEHGIESTVCGLHERRVVVYRRGAVTREDLEAALGGLGIEITVVDKFATSHSAAEKPAVGEVAPGQLLTHYAPRLPAFLAALDADALQSGDDHDQISASVVVDFGGRLAPLSTSVLAYRDLSPTADPKAAAAGLFDTLRWAEDVPGAARVLIADLSDDRSRAGLVAGVADRCFRAASGRKLRLRAP